MTQAQKIIKYIAIALAVLLIVTIISGILIGSYTLLSSFGLIKENSTITSKELKVISTEVTDLTTLKIDLSYTNLYMKNGNKFEVQTNNNKVTFENNNGSVKIKEEISHWLNNKNIESNLIIYIPENITKIAETDINSGAGKITIEYLNTKGLNLELGAGEVYIKNVKVISNAQIDGGLGNTEISNSKLNNLDADLGVGAFKFQGELVGNSKINSGIGTINLDLIGQSNDYTIKVSKGLGNITLDGEKQENDVIKGNGPNFLEVDGGIGEIKIDFIK